MAPGRVAANGHGEPRCGGGISHRQVRSSSSAVTSRGNLAGRRLIPHRVGRLIVRRWRHTCPERGRGGLTMQLTRVLREGFIAAMLGSAVFWGAHDPAQVVIEYSRIIGYTMIHVSAFIVVGTIAAVLAAEVEITPHTFYPVVVFFAIFEG